MYKYKSEGTFKGNSMIYINHVYNSSHFDFFSFMCCYEFILLKFCKNFAINYNFC